MLVTTATVAGSLHEGAVAFVGLDHHPVAGAEPRIGAVGVDDAAVDDGRIEPAGSSRAADHRGRGRLAVRAGDRDRPFQAHQLAPASRRGGPPAGARARAATTSGLSGFTAEEMTTTSASSEVLGASWPIAIGTPSSTQPLELALSA